MSANYPAVPFEAVRGTNRPRAKGIEKRPDDQLDLVGRIKLRRVPDGKTFWANGVDAREIVGTGGAEFVLVGDPDA